MEKGTQRIVLIVASTFASGDNSLAYKGQADRQTVMSLHDFRPRSGCYT